MIYLIENIELLSQLTIDVEPQIVKASGAISVGAGIAIAAGVGLLKGAIAGIGKGKKWKEKKKKEKLLEAQIAKVENFEFTNTFADMEAAEYDIERAQMAQLGDAALIGDRMGQMKGSKLGRARGYTSRGYEGEGYDSQGYTAGQTNISGLQRGAATGLTNTMSNLQVSTAASEMAAQEADQSLAASQDLAAQAGTGAGGATALAAAAAKSKAGISADIDRQVKQNEMMRAQGESELQRAQLAQGNLASQFDLGQSQFNVGAVNQAAQFGAAAANQAAQFGADARNQANRFTADAANQAARFKAQAQNQFAMTQFGADQAMEQFNVGAKNQGLMTDVGTQNQYNLTSFGAQNQMNMLNAQQQTAANQYASTSDWNTQMAIAQGDASVQNNQYGQLQDILNVRGGQAAQSANAVANQDAQIKGALTSGVNMMGSAAMASDRRLKKNIKLIGLSPAGLKIYQFKYKDSSYGDKIYEGVMSDEIPSLAIVKHKSGYDYVDYSKIDVDFKTITI